VYHVKKTAALAVGVATGSILLLSPGGCLANRTNLVEHGIVTIERTELRRLYFPWVGVYLEDHKAVVSGSIRRRPQYQAPVQGVVAVELISPTGEILEHVETPYFPRSIPTGGARHSGPRRSQFKVRLNTLPPKGSIVRVAHHARRGAEAE
jgi:hypothetical protein